MACDSEDVQDGYDSARRGHKMQAGLSGTALESRAKVHHSAGGACYGYTTVAATPNDPDSPRLIVIDKAQAKIVRDRIFKPWIAGQSCKQIAKDLNAAGIDSPGAR